MVKYFETVFKACVKMDLNAKNLNENISNGINYCLKLNERTRELHLRNGIKGYCFFIKDFCPIKMGQLVNLVVRCCDRQMMDDFIEALLMKDTDYFMCQDIISNKEITYDNYTRRYAIKTLAPAVVAGVDISFKDTGLITEILGINLAKKYQLVTREDIPQDYSPIAEIKILSKAPIGTKYKDGTIYGNKLLVKFKTDELAQKMAFIAMGCGLGQKNSIGFGFCRADNDYLCEF